MHGLLQTSFFFGYNAVVCFAFFLMLGSVGWRASLLFVRSIYKVSKQRQPLTHIDTAGLVLQGVCGNHVCHRLLVVCSAPHATRVSGMHQQHASRCWWTGLRQ
jgi:hypothetical protein